MAEDSTPRREIDRRILIEQAAREYWGMINSRLCPHCGKPFTTTEQRGRCTYALPCWHRLYQGRRP